MMFIKNESGPYLVTEEAARDVDLFAAHNGDLLSGQDLLGNNASETAQKVALAVDDDWRRRESGHF